MSDVYISYSRRDLDFAVKLNEYLIQKGITVWFDQVEIKAGRMWRELIVNAIKECKVVLIILSPESVRSKFVQKDLELAEHYGKNILPVMWRKTELSPGFEYVLVGLQWIDFAQDDSLEDDSLEKLDELVDLLEKQSGKTSMQPSKLASASVIVANDIVVQQQTKRIIDTDPTNIQAIAASQIEILRAYYVEVLSQAQKSFWWAIIAAGIGLAFFLTAVLSLLLQGSQSIATVSVISGALIEVISGINFYLYGKTSNQLADFQTRLDTTQRILLANSICESLDSANKQEARLEIIRVVINNRDQLTPSELLKPASPASKDGNAVREEIEQQLE